MSKQVATRPTTPARARGQRTLASPDVLPVVTAGKTLKTEQNISGNNSHITQTGNITIINSDELIMSFLDLIAKQNAIITELTDKVLSQASEIIELKLKLKHIEI